MGVTGLRLWRDPASEPVLLGLGDQRPALGTRSGLRPAGRSGPVSRLHEHTLSPAWADLRAHRETETGAAVFVGESQSVAIVPPFPMGVDGAFEGLHAAPLTEAVEKDRLVGVLLVRLGRYAVGVVNHGGLVASKTDTRHVKNRHRAGGSSQRRFERSRERLIRELFDKVCVVAKDVLGPYEDRMDYLFLGGERQTLRGLTKRCPFLRELAPITMKRVLDVRRPGLNALQHVEEEVWKSRVLVLERT